MIDKMKLLTRSDLQIDSLTETDLVIAVVSERLVCIFLI